MSYATPSNVKSYFRDWAEPSDGPAITDDELQEWLDSTFAKINAKLGTMYTLPITLGANPLSYPIVKDIEAMWVAGIADDVLNSYGEADKKPSWKSDSKTMLKELVPQYDKKTCKQCPPTSVLPDVTFLGTKKQRAQITISKTSGAIFRKGQDDW